jgi:hypothetical protein
MCFGSNPDVDSEVDIAVALNVAPTSQPTAQVLVGSGTSVAAGQVIADRERMRFEAVGLDADGDDIHLEVELRPAGSAFLGQATSVGSPVPSGSVASCTISLSPGSFDWQSRIVDSAGAGSAWTPFAGAGVADFRVEWSGSAGTACGSSASGGVTGILASLAFALALRRQLKSDPRRFPA